MHCSFFFELAMHCSDILVRARSSEEGFACLIVSDHIYLQLNTDTVFFFYLRADHWLSLFLGCSFGWSSLGSVGILVLCLAGGHRPHCWNWYTGSLLTSRKVFFHLRACAPRARVVRASKSNSNRLGKCIREAIYSFCAPKKDSNSLSILFSIFPSWVSHHSRWPYFPSESLLSVFSNLARLL